MFGASVRREAPGILRVMLRNGQKSRDMGVALGDYAGVAAVRKKMALRFVECGSMAVSNVTVWAAPGMALQEAMGEGGSRYTYTVTPGPAPAGGGARLLSSTADAFHSSSVRKGPLVDHCLFEGQGDDGVAIHGAYCLVTSTGSSSNLVFAPKYAEMPYRRGDPVRLYDGQTFRLKGEARIERVARTDPPAGALRKTIQALWARYRDEGMDKRYYALVLDHVVSTDVGDLLCSPACSGNGFAVRDTIVRHHRGRGMLIKSSEGVIEGNHIEDNTHAGIALGPEFSTWLEGDYVRNVFIRNNVLRDVGIGANCMLNERSILAGAITVGASTPERTLPVEQGNRNLVFEGNRVESTGGIGMLIACAQDVQVKSNWIGATRILGTMRGGDAYGVVPDASIFVASSSRVRFEANQISGKGIVVGTNVVEIVR